MKKISVFIAFVFVFVSYVYGEQKVNADDWEKYQQYKQEQENKISVSDKEYEEYKQYLKEKENANKEQSVIENKEIQKESSNEEQNTIETKSSDNKINENELIVKFGKILTSNLKEKIKSSYYGTSKTVTDTDSDGWVASINFIHYLADNTGLGLNVGYHSTFESNDMSYLNSDILLKQRFPMSFREKTYLYLVGGLGYGFLTGKTKEYYTDEFCNYYMKVNGGLHWMLSFGLDFTPFIIDLTYSCNYIDIDTNHIYGISADGSYCSFILSVGYKFEL